MDINTQKTIRITSSIILFLILASIAGQFIKYHTGHDYIFGLIPKFYLGEEQNIPTYFSSLLLLSCSVMLFIAGNIDKNQGKPKRYWHFLSLVFLFLSMDETAGMHELLTVPLRNTLHLSGPLFYSWVIVAVPAVTALFLSSLGFLKRLPAKTRNLFILSGAIYISGCVLMEMIGANFCSQYGTDNFGCTMIVTLEESLEMFGINLFLYSLLDYCRTASLKTTLSFY